MATVSNPTDWDLVCEPAGRVIPAGGSIQVADYVAARVDGSPVFVVQTKRPVGRPPGTTKPDSVAEDVSEGAVPRRTSTRRGGKRAEIVDPPAAEHR